MIEGVVEQTGGLDVVRVYRIVTFIADLEVYWSLMRVYAPLQQLSLTARLFLYNNIDYNGFAIQADH